MPTGTPADAARPARGDDASKPSMRESPMRALAAWLARFLQVAVLVLENFIEWLGQEPERNWEVMLFLRGFPVRPPSADALVKHAKKYADKGDAELALRLFIKVLEAEPDRTDVLDASAELLAELGDVDGAKDLLLRSVELAPEVGHAKYVLLGHLEHGARAVERFERGYHLLKAEETAMKNELSVATKKGGGDAVAPDPKAQAAMQHLRKQISSVLCAIAKVYLTDCFMEDHSLEHCDALLDQALTYDPDNPEACQALADLRLTQDRRGESLLLIRRTVEVCHHLPDGLAPTYDFRTVTARLLVELSQYDTAVSILSELTAEDDEDAEVLFLLGICHMLSGQPGKCAKVLGRAKSVLAASGAGAETQLVRQIDALLKRRSVTEAEKRAFWNPRWWVEARGGGGGGDAAEAGAEAEAEDGLEASDGGRAGTVAAEASVAGDERPNGAAAARGGDERGLEDGGVPEGAFEMHLPGAAVPGKMPGEGCFGDGFKPGGVGLGELPV